MIGMKKLSEQLHREGRCPCEDCKHKRQQEAQDRIVNQAWAEATFRF